MLHASFGINCRLQIADCRLLIIVERQRPNRWVRVRSRLGPDGDDRLVQGRHPHWHRGSQADCVLGVAGVGRASSRDRVAHYCSSSK